MSSHNLQELLRGAGLHIGLTDTTCGLVIILWVRKSPMMVMGPRRLRIAGMIRYERTEWYGFFYLFRLAGSTLPRCLPAVLLAAAIAAFFSSGVIDRAGLPIRDFFGHPYAMQVLGLVFGYLSINRLNVSYNRIGKQSHTSR